MHDWKPVARRLLGGWPQQVSAWGEEGIAAYCAELERRGVTPEAADRALDGVRGTFPPSAPELAERALPRAGTTNAAEAWALVEEASRRFGCSIYSDRFDEQHQAAVDWIAERDPVVGWWAARRGVFQAPGSLCQEPVNDPRWGGATRSRLAKEYEGVQAEARERVALGEPPVPRGALRVASRQFGGDGMATVVEGLRPARELEAGSDDD